MGCTVSTCNYTEPVISENNFNNLNELDLPIHNMNNRNVRTPYYKRQNSLTIDTSWGV